MGTHFSYSRTGDGTETIVLLGTDGPRIIPGTHVNFDNIKMGLMSDRDVPESDLYRLADAAATVADTLRRLSERVTIKGDTIYFDGDEMENRLTRHIVDMIRTGDENYAGYVKFLENVKANPSRPSRKALFKFLDKHGLTITRDGCFIGYKGVSSDGRSIHFGNEDVTVTLADGTVEIHKGRIPYPVGATVEMARSLVDPDRDSACSVGLHVGTHDYATSYASSGLFMTVSVNPRDVVAVPSDSNDAKIRAHRLTVLENNAAMTHYTGTSFVPADDVDGEEDYDDDTDGFYGDEYDEGLIY